MSHDYAEDDPRHPDAPMVADDMEDRARAAKTIAEVVADDMAAGLPLVEPGMDEPLQPPEADHAG
jgi:hypothetical protein